MAVAKITGQGLAAIAVVVCLLWACLLAERFTLARAHAETALNVRALKRLRAIRPAHRPAPRAEQVHRLTL
jgi:hypothetical protein